MSFLFRIVYAAHANGTHHKLALDALTHMQCNGADAWHRVFLKHAATYLEGAKAPDTTFKDFKNHVLHVADNFWGGAPEKVEEWYGLTVAALRNEQWQEAVYAAGVLSHYFTDPVMPFHTAQTEAENAIHRATEWSISRSYDALRKIGEERFATLAVPAHSGPSWQQQMTCDAAEFSHRYYEKLIAHYDITRGVVTPEAGLDAIAQNLVAELLIYAARGCAIILDRAIEEAAVTAPDVALSLETLLAAAQIPAKWLEKRLGNAEDRRLVRATYDELMATGKVDRTLSEDDRAIRDLYAREVLAPKLASRSLKRAKRFPDSQAAALGAKVVKYTEAMAQLFPVTTAELPKLKAAIPQSIAEIASVARPEPSSTQTSDAAASRSAHAPEPSPPQEAKPSHRSDPRPPQPGQSDDHAPPDTYLYADDPLEDAPSIGPKMAARFAELGILTVGDFLDHDPSDMAELLDDSRISTADLADWQDQAQLVMSIPGLRGGGAQLLVGAGYHSAAAVADADLADLSANILAFATTPEGKRILRDGTPPDIEKIGRWITAARLAKAA